MRIFAMMIATVALPTMASAAVCEGSATLLTVEYWKVEKVEGMLSGIDITIEVKSNATKPFRMVDGSYIFWDALGRRISGFKFDPDLTAKPGQTVESGAGYMGSEMDRVLKMNRSDIKVTTCTRAVVYADGSKEEFK